MSIESFFDYENVNMGDILVCKFVANGKQITDLRTVAFLTKMNEVLHLFQNFLDFDEKYTILEQIFSGI